MAIVADIKKTVTDATPVYVAVGVTDLAAEKLREARTSAVEARRAAGLSARKALESVSASVSPKAVQRQVQEVPAVALNRTLELAGKAQSQYEELASRGETLVHRIRTQKATQDLVAQVDQTVASGRGAVTTMRKAVTGTQAAAKATITTGRHQAVRVADVAADAVTREAKDAARSAEVVADVVADAAAEGARRTASSAKRTRTTASKGAKATTSRTKATATSARKAAPRARKATTAGARKVGTEPIGA
jgi:heparin binding hemagglutinin HbhA